jgi:hypothetical protein
MPMKIASKCSLHCGKEMSRKHNTRKYDKDLWNKDGHIDETRFGKDVIIIDQGRRQVFDDTFGDALVAYNERERNKHPDRLIGFANPQEYDKATPAERRQKAVSAYYKEHKRDCQESMIQLGDEQVYAEMCARYGQDKADKYYTDYLCSVVTKWQQDNPALRVFGAYVHVDETTPHLHLDWFPVKESNRGLSVACSLDGALQMQGYKRQKSDKFGTTPYKQWLADTRAGFEAFAQEFCDKNRLDVVILPAEKSTHKHKEPGEWREEQRQKKQAQTAVDRLTAPKTLADRMNPKAIAERDAAAQYIINHAQAAANAITAAAEQKQKDADKAMQTAQAIAKQAEKEKQITRQKLAAADTELSAMWRMAERNAVLLSRLIGDIPDGQRMVDRQRNDRLRGRFRDEPEHQKEEKHNVKENAETRGDNIRRVER